MQPTDEAVLLQEVLTVLVQNGALTFGTACGLVRMVLSTEQISKSLSDLRTAAWVCKTLKYFAAGGAPFDGYADILEASDLIRVIYASCRVNLLDLLPQVRIFLARSFFLFLFFPVCHHIPRSGLANDNDDFCIDICLLHICLRLQLCWIRELNAQSVSLVELQRNFHADHDTAAFVQSRQYMSI